MTTLTAEKKGARIFTPKKARAAAAALRKKKAQLEDGSIQITQSPSLKRKPKMAYRSISEPAATAAAVATPSFLQIQQRAYEFFLERGGQHGSDRQDWLRAEKELRGRA